MTTLIAVQFVILVLLFVCSAFFSASETALLSLNPVRVHRIRQSHPKSADRIERILSLPSELLSTILIGNTLVNVVAAAVGYVIAESFFPNRGEAISIPVMTLLLLLLGEVTPKRLAISRAERLAVLFAPLLNALIVLMTPLRVALDWITRLIRKDQQSQRQRALTADEFLTVVEVGEEEGVLDEEERTMVEGIIGLQKIQASQVMTPRVDLVGIDLDDPTADRERIARTEQFRYLPVYKRTLDRPEGFLDVPRFLLDPDRNFEAATNAPFFVPATASLDSLLATFQREHRHVAFVVDEFGGTAGLITMGDILEEIVGDVESDIKPERLTIQKMAENRWIVDGSTSLDDINYELDVSLQAENVDRISGWISTQTGHVPRTGEIVEAQGCRITVHRTRKNRVVTVFIEKILDEKSMVGSGI